MNFPATVQSYKVVRGARLARGTTIDAYLSDAENQTLYQKWQRNWPEPLEFSGGVTAITCEMVLEVPEAELKKIYGKKLSERFLTVSRANGG